MSAVQTFQNKSFHNLCHLYSLVPPPKKNPPHRMQVQRMRQSANYAKGACKVWKLKALGVGEI